MTGETKNKNTPYIVVIGGANMDICGASDQPLMDEDSNPGKITTSAGGVARNIADNTARLGLDTVLMTVLGDDIYGKELLIKCERAGIDCNYILKPSHGRTSTYLSVMDSDGDMSVAINDMAIMDQLSPDFIKSNIAKIKGAEAIVIDTNLSDDALRFITQTFRGQKIIVDGVSASKVRRIKPYLAAVHTLKVNQQEAKALRGKSIADNEKLAKWLHVKGVNRVFITLGEKGVYYSDLKTRDLTSANTAKPVNTTGAGDAFLAGAVCASLANWDEKKIVAFGVAAAQVAMAHKATINPAMSFIEVVKKMKENNEF